MCLWNQLIKIFYIHYFTENNLERFENKIFGKKIIKLFLLSG